MKDVSIFKYDSREIRTVDVEGETFWVAKDVCDILGYNNVSQTLEDHCKGISIRYPLQTAGGTQEFRVINEPDLFRLIIKSQLPSAERFERWVFEEILPSIRKTGQYILEQRVAELEESISEDHKTLKSVMEFAGKIITMQEDVKNKKVLGEKLFNSRKFNITVSSPNKEEQ